MTGVQEFKSLFVYVLVLILEKASYAQQNQAQGTEQSSVYQHLNASWLWYTFILHVGEEGGDWVRLFVQYWEEVEKLLNSGLASMSTLRRIGSKKA